jgi:hypothetical protein
MGVMLLIFMNSRMTKRVIKTRKDEQLTCKVDERLQVPNTMQGKAALQTSEHRPVLLSTDQLGTGTIETSIELAPVSRTPGRMPLSQRAFAEIVFGRIAYPPARAEHPPTAIEQFCVKEPCEHPR